MLHNEKARLTARLTTACYLALLLTLIVTTFVPAPVAGVSVTLVLTVKLVPLLAFLLPVYRGHNRGYIWMTFVVLIYFTQAVVSAWLSQGAPGPVLLTLLCVLLVICAMIHLKVNRPVPA